MNNAENMMFEKQSLWAVLAMEEAQTRLCQIMDSLREEMPDDKRTDFSERLAGLSMTIGWLLCHSLETALKAVIQKHMMPPKHHDTEKLWDAAVTGGYLNDDEIIAEVHAQSPDADVRDILKKSAETMAWRYGIAEPKKHSLELPNIADHKILTLAVLNFSNRKHGRQNKYTYERYDEQ